MVGATLAQPNMGLRNNITDLKKCATFVDLLKLKLV
jgi:hypothetical protein